MKADRIIATLIAITLGLIGVAYSAQSRRLDALESERKTLEQVARDAAVTAATVRVEIASLKDSVQAISTNLAALNDAMQRNDAARDILLARTAALMSTLASNRKDYQRALSDWADANDALIAAAKKKATRE